MIDIVKQRRDSIEAICLRFGVRRLEIFGSACTSAFNPERSDLDFLVEFPHDYDFGPWLRRLQELQAALSQLFGRRVDLVMDSAVHDPLFRRLADQTRTTIYDASQEPQVAA